jgi:hypothetical protein
MSGQPPLLRVSDAAIEDLRGRLRMTGWPTRWPVEPWAAGTDASVLERLVEYWANGYDWRVWEAVINELPSRYADIAGHQLHYLKFDGETHAPIPIVLTNGWPSTLFEMVELARRLANPSAFGVTDEISFTAIVRRCQVSRFPANAPCSRPTLRRTRSCIG